MLGVTALDAQQPEPKEPMPESKAAPGTPPVPKARTRKPKPPGVREQTSRTFAAGMDLARAHVELAKAEASAIGQESGRFAGLAAGALALVLLAALLAVIGTALFIGDWIYGSIGWGVVHGVLAFVSIAVALVLLAVRVEPVRIARALLIGVVIAVLTSVILGLGLLNQAYASIGSTLGLAVDPGLRPLVVGMGMGAIIGVLLGILIASRMTNPNWFAAIAGGIALGVLLGAFTSITFSPQIGAAIGTTLAYLIWVGLMGLDVYRTGIDQEALKARFTPTRSIETGKETLEWLQQRMPHGNGS